MVDRAADDPTMGRRVLEESGSTGGIGNQREAARVRAFPGESDRGKTQRSFARSIPGEPIQPRADRIESWIESGDDLVGDVPEGRRRLEGDPHFLGRAQRDVEVLAAIAAPHRIPFALIQRAARRGPLQLVRQLRVPLLQPRNDRPKLTNDLDRIPKDLRCVVLLIPPMSNTTHLRVRSRIRTPTPNPNSDTESDTESESELRIRTPNQCVSPKDVGRGRSALLTSAGRAIWRRPAFDRARWVASKVNDVPAGSERGASAPRHRRS